MTRRERHLLVNCVRTYVVLRTQEERQRYEALMKKPDCSEVKQMKLTWDEQMWYAAEERGEKRGERKGKAEMLVDSIREFWEVRFGPMSPAQRERLLAMQDLDRLLRVRAAVFRATDPAAEASLA